ncbi:hypothetical protein ABIE26_000219 [Pedobacter africanus]|uniref:Uncharacterized protein n=1 Tax=Pedobacter africanus TaxID=151894 RepID=A0ACC6KVY5_9SPHI|nr:DUF6266 family protein [Pedobacter africanus]MDR6783293.1 hypothetical protein [Pedobacter africanus]
MAKLNNGIFGAISGKIGNIEGYIRKGQPLIRLKKRKSNIPPSLKQLAVRQKMKVVNTFIGSMTEFVAAGFGLAAANETYTANNAAKSNQLLNAIQGEYPDYSIDYSKVRLTEGILPMADDPQVTTLANGLLFTWGFDVNEGYYYQRQQVMLLAYAPAINKSFYTVSGARRITGAETMELPHELSGQVLECYISFVADDRKAISNSVYVGQITY